MTLRRTLSTWAELATEYLLPFGFGAILMASVNVAVLEVFSIYFPSASQAYFRICVSPLIAALQEPISSKLLPATIVFVWAKRDNRLQELYRGRYRLAALGGLTVGAIEAMSKNVRVFPPSIDLSANTLPPILMHSVTGFVIGLAIYSVARRSFEGNAWVRILLALSTAIGVHFLWNSWVAFLLAGQNPC